MEDEEREDTGEKRHLCRGWVIERGGATTAHINHWEDERTAGMEVDQNEEMMTSVERRLLSESGSVVCFTTSEGGGEKGYKEAGDFLPLVPWNERTVPQGWAGPLYNTIRGAGVGEFPLPPPSSLSLSPSFLFSFASHAQTREHQHVYIWCANIHSTSLVCVHTPNPLKSVLHLFLHCKRSYKIKREGGWMDGWVY